MMNFKIIRNATIDYHELHELRLAVGWPSDKERAKGEIENCYSNFSIRHKGQLIGYLNTISDGVSDALLNNLIVRPGYQRKGIGRALLKAAVEELSRDGVKYFNIVFEEDLVPFYKKCGFHMMRSGIIDLTTKQEVL